MNIITIAHRFFPACLFLLLAYPLFCDKPSEVGEKYPENNKIQNTSSPLEATIPSEHNDSNILNLTVQETVLLSLEHNGSLKVQRFNTSIKKTYEKEELGAFDPILSGDLSYSRKEGTTGTPYYGTVSTSAGVSFPFPTGTEVGGGLTVSGGDESSIGVSVNLSQELLKGGQKEANLASVRQAQLDSFYSEYELRGYTEALVSSVETAYWDCFSAQLSTDIYQEGLRLAEQQLSETRERVQVGSIPEIELIAAKAEVALRQEALLIAESQLERSRLKLLYLLNLPGDYLYDIKIVQSEQPQTPVEGIDDLIEHLKSALRMRPDLNQALLSRRRNELEVVKTKNGLLPRLELFISLGKTGYSESFSGAASGLVEGGPDLTASLTLSYPIGNREAQAKNERAVLTEQQTEASIQNLKKLIELDVRSAYLDASRTREQIDVTSVSRSLQEEKLRAEMEKFRVGRSTALLVAQSQRDLLNSRVAEKEAFIGHLKALINLYRLDGSLLLRRGIEVAGAIPVEEKSWPPEK